jgi:aspartate racemase
LLALAARPDKGALIEYLVWAVRVLVDGGADLALFAANTPHVVFSEVAERTAIPMVSIVLATRDEASRRGLRRLGLVGTRVTMQGEFYRSVFAARGLAVVAPDEVDQAFVHEKYMTELLEGQFADQTRDALVRILDRLRASESVDGVILGGTELPILLRGLSYEVPLLDTTRLHVEAAMTQAGYV